MAMDRSPIEFFFDFASPYAYLAACRVEAVAADLRRAVRWRPILLGVVFKVTSGHPNLMKPLQGDYLRHDVPRCARRWGIPVIHPLPMPFASLAASRGFYWLEGQGDGHLPPAFARAIFNAHWADGRDMAMPENVLDVAAGLGIDRDAMEQGITETTIKERLRAETDAAIARGVCGAPFFLVEGEPFWGADRLDQMAEWLRTGGW
jgi:2-hydroxychromene-2-carboxylate isomerase